MLDCIAAMKAAAIPISFDREMVAAFCRAHGIRRLSLFGSVLREDFDPARSDIDVLAEFGSGALRDVGFRYFGFADELATILGHKVDFCSRLHPALESQVRQEAVPIYEQA
jgi:predicted nucleotidyltransferase